MILLKLLIIGICATLNFWGGKHWLWTRRILMPLIIAGFIAWQLKLWYLLFLVGIPFYGALTLPDDCRAFWCGTCAIGASIVLYLTGHLHLYFFIPYVLGNAIIGWVMNDKLKADQFWNDVVEGVGFASLVFLV